MIKFYKHPEYHWLSNFHVAIMTIQGHQWPSCEHFYQAMKAVDPETQAKIRCAETPAEAKKLGRVCECREDWEQPIGTAALHKMFSDDRGIVVHTVKDHFMFQGLIAKFTQRKELREALLLTGDQELA